MMNNINIENTSILNGVNIFFVSLRTHRSLAKSQGGQSKRHQQRSDFVHHIQYGVQCTGDDQLASTQWTYSFIEPPIDIKLCTEQFFFSKHYSIYVPFKSIDPM